MYHIGDLIIYGSNGVCRVEAIGTLDISWIDKSKLFYTLCPLYSDGKIFAPINTNVFMRPIVTFEEAQQLIDIIPSIRENICDDWHPKVLEEHYSGFLHTHDCADLLKLIKTIYIKNYIVIKQGKQLGQTDRKFMKKAEDLLYGEFAIALGMPKENVKSYIEYRVEELEKSQ